MIAGTIRVPAGARRGAAGDAGDDRRQPRRGCCLAYSYAEDVGESGLIRVHECWRDAAALDRHFTAPHLAAWRAQWPALGIGHRALTLYEVRETRPA